MKTQSRFARYRPLLVVLGLGLLQCQCAPSGKPVDLADTTPHEKTYLDQSGMLAMQHAQAFSVSVKGEDHEVRQDGANEVSSSAASVAAIRKGCVLVRCFAEEVEIEGPFCKGSHFANLRTSGEYVFFDEVFPPEYTLEEIGLPMQEPRGGSKFTLLRSGIYDGRTFCLNVTEGKLLYASPFWWKD